MNLGDLPPHYQAAAVHPGLEDRHVLVLAWTLQSPHAPVLKGFGEELTVSHWHTATLQNDTPGWVGRQIIGQWIERDPLKLSVRVVPLSGWLINSRGKKVRQVAPIEAWRAVQQDEVDELLAEAGPGWWIASL